MGWQDLVVQVDLQVLRELQEQQETRDPRVHRVT